MRTLLLTVLLTMLTLTTSADEVTTNNVLNQTFTSGNNWTGQLSSNHGTGTIAGIDEGYVENTEAYSLVDDVGISTDQLNNGFTSNQSAKVWFWNSNNQDVVMKQTITNSDGNVTVQTKTVTGSCATFNGCSYQDTGNNTYSIGSNTQTDFDIKTRFEFNSSPSGSASYSGTHRAADLKQPVLTVTYDDTVLEQDASDALDDVEEALEDLQDEVFDDMEEFFFEEETFTFNEEPQFEMEMEMETFTFAEEFIEEFFMEMDEEFFMEEDMSFEEGPMFEFTDTEMEEIYEETNEIVATFLPMVSEEEEFSSEESFVESDGPFFMESTEDGETFTTETFQEEEIMEEESPMMTETFEEEEMIEEEEMMEEEPTEMAEEEMVEEENTEMAEEEAVEEEPTEMVEATNEEEIKEEKSDSETPKKSAVQTKKLAKQKKIRQKKAIVKNLAKIMDKVDKDIKDISKNLAIKNIIKMEAMTSEQASLAMYQNAVFYKPEDIYLDQLNIFDNRQLYPNTSLASYIQNDKIEIKARKLQEINLKKQRLLIELRELKNG